jgi:iron(III) transport system substrate-binding protein
MSFTRTRSFLALLAGFALVGALAVGCGDDDETITLYAGRSESLIGPLIERFEAETGITVDVRYGSTTEMATTILEEGANSPADVFIAQDTGGLGAVQLAGLFEVLDDSILEKVDPRWRSDDGGWVGLSGRARVMVYNSTLIQPEDLPASIADLVDPEWRGRFGWAPTNGSLQAFVTAMRLVEGDEATQTWMEGIIANDAQAYGNNNAILDAVAAGEVEFGLVNHYYLHARLADQGDSFPDRNHYGAAGTLDAFVGVAGGGILASSKHQEAATRFIEFLLSDESQTYFADTTYEYPVVSTVPANADLPSLNEIQPPDIDLDDLADLEGTLALMRAAGALE